MRILAILLTLIFAAPVFAQSGVQEDKGDEIYTTNGDGGTTGISGGSRGPAPADMDKTVRGGKQNAGKSARERAEESEDINRDQPQKDADRTDESTSD